MKIDVNDMYVISFTEGMYDSEYDFEDVYVEKETATQRFKELIAKPAIDGCGEVALYKANLVDNRIVANYETAIMHKYYTDKSRAWVDECPWGE